MTTKLTALQVMQDAPVIPVIVLNNPEQAVALARALVAGGIRMLEVTLRTPVALECIRNIVAEVPRAVVGAGTVCSVDQAQAAVEAGAEFLVSPGYTAALGHACQALGTALLPGVSSPSDIMLAGEAGYTELKFFPAVQSGGLAMLKALGGPFGEVTFCPTGGMTIQNAHEFLALPNVACVGGSWLSPADALADEDFDRITLLASEAAGLHSYRVR